MSKSKFELNYSGVGQLLRGSEMKTLISGIAQSRTAEAGEGYGHREHDSGQRIIANIYPATHEAWQDNMQNNTLLKVLHK